MVVLYIVLKWFYVFEELVASNTLYTEIMF